ncbi:patatin-like phospholipase family protein [Dyadobacter sp. CY261]|uniref:patatin-like phospholipase family protein n=1 Tax=Dyadobacter sp. CY261 TaxID=2907203 RepID=UPI001F2077F4|nr:patatin-like phospholipase family protein [Dyadobacter sp. CY261]MCF0074639.1 patatin-like phospholipase family protein [Dyadobacter sp. CY261]
MKTALILSGGGARGIAHVGVAQALWERGVRPDVISGTSSGAFVGALLGHGYEPTEVLKIIRDTSFYPYLRFGIGANGLLHMRKMEDVFRKFIPENTFESLRTPLIVTATDIVSGEEIRFRSGELALPVLASCCIPGLFSPMHYNGHELVDGGVLNNLPVEPVLDKADYLIGSHCNPFNLDKPLKRTTEIVYRSLILAMHTKTKARGAQCDLLIEPPALSRFSIFDFRKADQLFQTGYAFTKALLNEPNTLLS